MGTQPSTLHLRCPRCRHLLAVRAGARRGTCSACGAALGVRRVPTRARANPLFGPPTPKTPAQARAQAARDFTTFHGVAPTVRRAQLPARRGPLWLLGDLESFAYTPPARSERGTDDRGRRIVWTHESLDHGGGLKWGRKPKVYSTADRKGLVIEGGSFSVDPSRGIVG